MATAAPPKSENPLASKKAYMELLRSLLRTNVESKAAMHFSKAMGDNGQRNSEEDSEDTNEASSCILNSAIGHNVACIKKIREMSDNVLVALLLVASKTRKKSQDPKVGQELAKAIQSLVTLTAEVVNISARFHETSIGLHVVVDFLRYPYDLSLLNFSRSGRVRIPHFSHVEASTMRLAWLHGAIEKALMQDNPELHLSLEHEKIYSAFEESLRSLRDASKLSAQVFRVLMYSNLQGKLILQEFVRSLQPPEKNDIILELNKLRVQHEQIAVLYERVGWSLTNIWTEYTKENLDFQEILREAKMRTEPLWNKNPSKLRGIYSSSDSKEMNRELRKLHKKIKEKKNKKGKGKEKKKEGSKKPSKKELFMERLVSLFGRNPSEFTAPVTNVAPAVAKEAKQTEEGDDSQLSADTSKLSIPAKRKPSSQKTKMHLLKSVSSSVTSTKLISSTKDAKALDAQNKLMRAKERGWK